MDRSVRQVEERQVPFKVPLKIDVLVRVVAR